MTETAVANDREIVLRLSEQPDDRIHVSCGNDYDSPMRLTFYRREVPIGETSGSMGIDIELLLTPKTARELGAQLLAGVRSIDANNMASLTTSQVDLREGGSHEPLL